MTSALAATETNATGNERAISPLEDLITRARLQSERMSGKNPTRQLLREMAVALVAQAHLVADLSKRVADTPRIILP